VNYYIQHLLVDAHGELNRTILWITDIRDPTLACHPIASISTDMVWSRVALGCSMDAPGGKCGSSRTA